VFIWNFSLIWIHISGYENCNINPAGLVLSFIEYIFVIIWISVFKELEFNMLDRKVSDERRQQKRFKAEEGAFAALVAQESRLGQIKDISARGLAFRYIDNNEKLENANELKIILGHQGLYLDKVPFKKISDFEIESEFSFSTVKMRQIGLEFGELTPGQQNRLNQFIKHHTIDEV
jgi:hypothetical protein